MLTKISIEGFKSIYNIETLELGQVNVFIGANGSGKSNFLEAVGTLGAAVSGRVDSESLRRRGVRLSPNELYNTSLDYHQAAKWISFGVEGKWNQSVFNYRVGLNSIATEFDPWVYVTETAKYDEKKIVNLAGVYLPPKGIYSPFVYQGHFADSLGNLSAEDPLKGIYRFLSEYAIFTPTTPVLRGIQPDLVSLDPLGLLGGRLAEAVEDILNPENHLLGSLGISEVLDFLDWVEGFDITAPSRKLLAPDVPSLRSIVQFQDRWMGKKRNRISGYDASEGALYVLFMLVLALHPRTPRFFAIDNFDQTLNPRLARALTRLFCELILKEGSSRQVLLTTHNPLVLDGLDLRDERIRLFATERNTQTKGATSVHRVKLSDNVLKTAENGTPLSQLWVMGLLGGVPDLF